MPPPGVRVDQPTISTDSTTTQTGRVEYVSSADFRSKVLEASGPIAVEFLSPSCPACIRANPMVHDVARGLAGRVKVYQVVVQTSPDLVQKYGIRATPTLVMFEGGRVKASVVPELTASGIRSAILGAFG